MKGTLMFVVSCFLNFLAVVDKTMITFSLGAISSALVSIYYAIRIYKEIKNKKNDVG